MSTHCIFIDVSLTAPLRDEEDEMLQLAIQQSLLEYQQDPAHLMSLRALRDSQQEAEDDLQRYTASLAYLIIYFKGGLAVND